MALPTLSNTPRPRALGYGARINDLLVRLAVAPGRELTFQSAPLEPPRVNTAATAEDIRNEFGALYSRADFSGGEGLDFAHSPDLPPNAARRYWDSQHIDVRVDRPGRLESIELLKEAEQIEASSDTNLHLAYDGSAIYMAEGNTVRRSTDFSATTPIFADDDPHAGQGAVTVNDLTAVGEDVYAALDTSGIHKRDGQAGTWSDISSFAATKVWGAKGFLLAAAGVDLSEVDIGTGTATNLINLPAGEEWLDLADAGQVILACASDGYIYAIGDDGSGGLELKAQTFIGDGITPCAVAARHGVVFYATAQDTGSEVIAKWWRADMTDLNVLANSVLIRQFGEEGDGVDRTPHAMSSTNDAVWMGVNEADAAYIWRYGLATAGRARWWDSGVSDVVRDLIFIEGDAYWTVENNGLYREHPTDFETEGYLIGPLGDLFTASAKAWVGALLDTEAVSAGYIELYYTTDPAAILDSEDSNWVRVRRITDSTLPDISERRIANVESRFIAGMIKIGSSSDQLTSPAARGFTFRAYPGTAEMLVELPINVSDRIEMPNRRRLKAKGIGDLIWQELKGIEGSAVELEVFSPSDLLRGVIEQVSTPVISQPERGSPTSVMFVRFRGKRVSATGTSESDAVWGGFMWGAQQWGTVES